MRQIVLDTETTGLEPQLGHRIIEIGCVELIDRKLTGNTYHQFVNPEREVDEGAANVHGFRLEDLRDFPVFSAIVEEFLEFVRGAELVIHNAPFDVGFLNHELRLMGPDYGRVEDACSVFDTLSLARRKHPGQRVSLDALCRRYQVDNAHRTLHGALLDAEILADVYLLMTGGQVALSLAGEGEDAAGFGSRPPARFPADMQRPRVIRASDAERAEHQQSLERIRKKTGGDCVWDRLEAACAD